MSIERQAIPADLYERLNRDFLDHTGQQTYDSLPEGFDSWTNLIKFFIAHYLASKGEIPTLEHYDYLKNIILEKYTDQIDSVVRQVAKSAITRYELWAYPCVLCNDIETIKIIINKDVRACTSCFNYQKRIVNANNRRAQKEGLLATLTTEEWIIRLVQYHRRCAYCGNPYQVLEHNIPLSRIDKYDMYPYEQRGTTYANCFPACIICNRKKTDSFPDEIRHIKIQKFE